MDEQDLTLEYIRKYRRIPPESGMNSEPIEKKPIVLKKVFPYFTIDTDLVPNDDEWEKIATDLSKVAQECYFAFAASEWFKDNLALITKPPEKQRSGLGSILRRNRGRESSETNRNDWVEAHRLLEERRKQIELVKLGVGVDFQEGQGLSRTPFLLLEVGNGTIDRHVQMSIVQDKSGIEPGVEIQVVIWQASGEESWDKIPRLYTILVSGDEIGREIGEERVLEPKGNEERKADSPFLVCLNGDRELMKAAGFINQKDTVQ